MTIALIVVAAYLASWRVAYLLLKRAWLRDLDLTVTDRRCFVVMAAIPAAGLFAGLVLNTPDDVPGRNDRVVERRRT